MVANREKRRKGARWFQRVWKLIHKFHLNPDFDALWPFMGSVLPWIVRFFSDVIRLYSPLPLKEKLAWSNVTKWGSPNTTAGRTHEEMRRKGQETPLIDTSALTDLCWGFCTACSRWKVGVWSSTGSCRTTGSNSRSWGRRRASGTVREHGGVCHTEASPSRVLGPECCPRWSLRSGPGCRCCHSNTAGLLHAKDLQQRRTTLSASSKCG